MTNRKWLALGVFIALLTGCGQNTGNTQTAAGADILPGTESFRDFGDYVLHFNALTTDRLSPAVASEYEIVRSPYRVLLNVSILQKQEIGLAMPVSGVVTATARNLTGQTRNIAIQEIREQDAIYYVGETSVANGESLIFTVEASVDGSEESLTVSFQKQFFVDE
jgi:outer membrane lipopolysaccharide assembly protein LptE/RlpB